MGARTAPPNTSTPCHPTVHRPKENLSSREGTKSFMEDSFRGCRADSCVGGECRVEGRLGRVEGQGSDEGQRFFGSAQTVHACVLPLDRDRPVVADGVEHAEAALPGNVAV